MSETPSRTASESCASERMQAIPVHTRRVSLADCAQEHADDAPVRTLDLDELAIPTPSRLHSRAPLGLDTWEVESLSSWVRRLARGHVVWASLLVEALVLAPDAKLRGLRHRAEAATRMTERINGSKPVTRMLVERLVVLTGRPEARRTCLLDRDAGINFLLALRNFRAWCPMCLAEDREPYDRLAWAFRDYAVCTRHRCQLEEACRSCGRRMLPLAAVAHPSACGHCGGSLASTSAPARGSHLASELIRALLARFESGKAVTQEMVARATRAEIRAAGGLAYLRRESGVAEPTLVTLDTQKHCASLESFLRLLVVSGLSLDAFLAQGASVRECRPGVGGRRPRQSQAPLHLLEALKAHLAQPDEQLVSLRRFATQQGVTDMYLRGAFPGPARELVRRWKAGRRAGRLARETFYRARLSEAFERACRETGAPPTRREIETVMGGAMRAPYLRALYRELMDPASVSSTTTSTAGVAGEGAQP